MSLASASRGQSSKAHYEAIAVKSFPLEFNYKTEAITLKKKALGIELNTLVKSDQHLSC